MQLLIVRHAKAHNPDFARWRDDSQRPLTAKGEARLERSAAAIAALVPSDVVVVTSPYVRARQTADLLVARCGWATPTVDERLAGHFGVDAAVAMLDELDGEGVYVIVGHDPTFSALPSYLMGSPRADATPLKTGAVALLDSEGFRPSARRWTLVGLMQPKMLAR